jgi:hypothetical protein
MTFLDEVLLEEAFYYGCIISRISRTASRLFLLGVLQMRHIKARLLLNQLSDRMTYGVFPQLSQSMPEHNGMRLITLLNWPIEPL